jgi:hypothetical protein
VSESFGCPRVRSFSAPSARHGTNVRTRLEQWISECFNTVHPRNGVEDDVPWLAGIVPWDLRQADLAERDPLAGVWPTHCCIVRDIAARAQLDLEAKLDRNSRFR